MKSATGRRHGCQRRSVARQCDGVAHGACAFMHTRCDWQYWFVALTPLPSLSPLSLCHFRNSVVGTSSHCSLDLLAVSPRPLTRLPRLALSTPLACCSCACALCSPPYQTCSLRQEATVAAQRVGDTHIAPARSHAAILRGWRRCRQRVALSRGVGVGVVAVQRRRQPRQRQRTVTRSSCRPTRMCSGCARRSGSGRRRCAWRGWGGRSGRRRTTAAR